MEKTYTVELKVGDNIIFDKNDIKSDEIIDVLKKNINNRELYPIEIAEDVKKNNGSACWCGSREFGYKIALNTNDNKYTDYYILGKT